MDTQIQYERRFTIISTARSLARGITAKSALCPSFFGMERLMFVRTHKPQIGYRVIRLIFINMVNRFIFAYLSAKLFLHHKNMLWHITVLRCPMVVWPIYSNITSTINVPAPLPPMMFFATSFRKFSAPKRKVAFASPVASEAALRAETLPLAIVRILRVVSLSTFYAFFSYRFDFAHKYNIYPNFILVKCRG